jgi:hypothetical protein
MFKLNRKAWLLSGAAALVIAPLAAYAGGSFQTLPVIGGASYCASTVSGAGNLGGIGGQGQAQSGSICGQTVPAGPTAFTGNEVVPADLNAPGTTTAGPVNTALVDIQQLGQGATQVVTTTTAAVTMAPGTSFLFVDDAEAAAFTVTLPASPTEGQFAEVACSVTTTGAMTVAANTVPASTVLLPAFTAAVCTAGTSFKYRYSAALNTWFKV